MKWNTTNYKGEPVTWYSGDVVEEIKRLCELHLSGKRIVFAQEVIDLIENEDSTDEK